MIMKTELSVLLIEDTLADAALIEMELHKTGMICHTQRVTSREEFLRELHSRPPDLILSDHGLASFDGFTALRLAREENPTVPFIFVTGALGEETAIEAFENGASDYVLKRNLAKLGPAVRRVLSARREEALVAGFAPAPAASPCQGALDEPGAEVGASLLLAICHSCKRIRDEAGQWHPLEDYMETNTGITFNRWLCPECALRVIEAAPGAAR